MIDKILQILEESKTVCYEKFPRDPEEGEEYSLSAVVCISPTCIDRIKRLYNLPINEEI